MNNPLGRYSDFSGDGGMNTNEKQGEENCCACQKFYVFLGGGGFGQPPLMNVGGNMGMIIRQEIQSIKAVIGDLQDDRDKLRNGIRKLKVLFRF